MICFVILCCFFLIINYSNNWQKISTGEDYELITNSKGELFGLGSFKFEDTVGENSFEIKKVCVNISIPNIIFKNEKIFAGHEKSFVVTDSNFILFSSNQNCFNNCPLNEDDNFRKNKIKEIVNGELFSIIILENNDIFFIGDFLNNYSGFFLKKKKLNVKGSFLFNKKIISVAAGYDFVIFLTSNNTLLTMGRNFYGQLVF
jgi:alpha-tubulin suppressor-like RCC1 family protein